jgi:hypothetical protein
VIGDYTVAPIALLTLTANHHEWRIRFDELAHLSLNQKGGRAIEAYHAYGRGGG